MQPVLAAEEELGLTFTAFKADPFPLISADSLPSSGCSTARNTPFSLLLLVWESCYKLLASQWAWRKDLYTSSHLAWNKPGSSFTQAHPKGKNSFLWPTAPRGSFVRTAQSVIISSGHTGPPLQGCSRRHGLCWARTSCLFITSTERIVLPQWPSKPSMAGAWLHPGTAASWVAFPGLPWFIEK